MKKVLISAGASLAESIQIQAVVKAFRKLGFNPVYLRYWHKRLPKGVNISKLYPIALLNGEKLFLAAKKKRPDLVLVLKGETFLPGSIARIKKLGIRTANWTVDDVFGVHNPFNRIVNIAEYDYAFSYDRYCVEELKMRGLNAHYLPCAADPDVYKEMPEIKPKYDVTFLGGHDKDREKILSQLLNFDLHIWGRGWLRGVKRTSPLYPHIHKEASYGVEMPKILNQSRITLNIHNKQSILSTNFRTFEALACRTFLLSDYNKELENLFQLDKELVCYRNIEELKRLIRYYLNNEEERERIAEAGQEKVHKENTTIHRIKRLMYTLL